MILLTDILFPSKYAKWRIEKIKSFIDDMDADILVFKVDSFAGINFEIDYEYMKDYFNLGDYNILIFDPKYNYINDYNKRIDGTLFNYRFPGSYLFTRKLDFNPLEYDCVYHIFLYCWELFNRLYEYPKNKLFIHLYAGGGFTSGDSLDIIDKDTSIISSQRFITDLLTQKGFIDFIEVMGSTLLQKDNEYTLRPINNVALNICFTSLGSNEDKGASNYINIVEKYKRLYPNDNIIFHSVGNCSPNEHINNHPPMAMKELENLYDTIDILINLETGESINGWPLGVESILQGSILITTDTKNQSQYFPFSKNIIIVEKNNMESVVDNIKMLYKDRELLNTMSQNIQKASNDFYSYENQQAKIFECIHEKYKHS